MSRRQIGQETFSFSANENARRSSLDELVDLIEWAAIEKHLSNISGSVKGEPAWPPLCLFKVLLLAVWYDPVGRQARRSLGRSRVVSAVLRLLGL
jgi:transposase, IS5 family